MRKFIMITVIAVLLCGWAWAGQIKIGYCCSNFNDTFQTYIVDAAKAAAAEHGIEIEVMDGQEDDIRQQDQVNTLIHNQVDALIVVPVNTSSIRPIVQAAQSAKIPLVFVNRNPYPDKQPPEGVYFIGADSILEGSTQMEYAGKLLEGKGGVCILMGLLSNEGAVNRTLGVHKIIEEKYPDITVIAEETANWQRDQGMNVTENWLTAYGDDIDAIIANNDEMALGAIMALRQAGRDDVIVIGIDATPDARAAIKNGSMSGSVLQDPVQQGKGSVEMAIKLVNGEKIQQMNKLPALLVTKENVDR